MGDVVEMLVEGVGRLKDGECVAVLRERDGPRTVGVGLGAWPARWISERLAGQASRRPNTYALSVCVIEQLGGRILRATIDAHGQAEPEPEAYVEIDGRAGVLEVGCSPQDAVALASYGGVPILVHDRFFRPGRGTPPGP